MPSASTVYHVPVLLKESVDGLNIAREGGIYVDATFGGGGHSMEILRRMEIAGGGHLYGFDQDEDTESNIPGDGNFTFVRSNFRYLKNWMRYYGVERIDGLIADLGVSSHHLDDAERGFSFRFDAPLDMRMNRNAKRTAADLLNEETEERIADILYFYGELKQARRMARAIVKARQGKSIQTTFELLHIVEPMLDKEREKKEQAKLFQALRIEVNHETEALCEMLEAAVGLLKTGGRLSVITYHSIEDRIVKNVIKAGNAEGKTVCDFYGCRAAQMKPVNRKVILPSCEEQQRNPRSRSAKLRVGERI